MDEDIYVPNVNYNPHAEPDQTTASSGRIGRIKNSFVDFVQTLVVFGAIFAIIYLFVAQPHKVSGNSMLPNFQNGNYILTDKLTYRFSEPKYNDVVVLKNPRNEAQDFIKRILGLPGDTIKIENGAVFRNGSLVKEDFLPTGRTTQAGNFLSEGENVTLGPNQYIVLGDNRDHSSDSREFGPISKKEIIGRVIFRYWPPNVIGFIPHYPLN